MVEITIEFDSLQTKKEIMGELSEKFKIRTREELSLDVVANTITIVVGSLEIAEKIKKYLENRRKEKKFAFNIKGE